MLPFKFIIEDPAGNSYIKNPFFPKLDPNLIIEKYSRTVEQLEMMGYHHENEEIETTNTEEDINKAVRERFHKLSDNSKRKEELSRHLSRNC